MSIDGIYIHSDLPTLTNEKLEDYLSVWNGLIERGYKSQLKIELTSEYGCVVWPAQQRHTLTYGEEKRELTYVQALRVNAWMLRNSEVVQ